MLHYPFCLAMSHSYSGALDAGEALRGSNLQDILRLLTLWFTHGAAPDVEKALEEGFTHVSIDTWLVVIPQARTAAGGLLTCLVSRKHYLPVLQGNQSTGCRHWPACGKMQLCFHILSWLALSTNLS